MTARDLPFRVELRFPPPVSVPDLPAIERAATAAAHAHLVDPSEVEMRQDGTDLVLSFDATAYPPTEE